MKWNSHIKIANIVASRLGLSESFREILLDAVIEPDRNRGFEHHHLVHPERLIKLVDEARKYVIISYMINSYLGRKFFQRALYTFGQLLHYLHDSLVVASDVIGYKQHIRLENLIDSKINYAIPLYYESKLPIYRTMVIKEIMKIKPSHDPNMIVDRAISLSLFLADAVFQHYKAPADIDLMMCKFWKYNYKKLKTYIPLVMVISALCSLASLLMFIWVISISTLILVSICSLGIPLLILSIDIYYIIKSIYLARKLRRHYYMSKYIEIMKESANCLTLLFLHIILIIWSPFAIGSLFAFFALIYYPKINEILKTEISWWIFTVDINYENCLTTYTILDEIPHS